MGLKWNAGRKKVRESEKPRDAKSAVEEFRRRYPWVEKDWHYEMSPGERAIAKVKAAINARRGKHREAGIELMRNLRGYVKTEEALRLFDEWTLTGRNYFLRGLGKGERKQLEQQFERIKEEILNPEAEFRVARSLALSGALKRIAETLAELAMKKSRNKKVREVILRNAAMLDVLSELRNVKLILNKRSPLGRTMV